MLRDLTMIFSVLVSVVSLAFGVYKNIEAGNARGFAYEQAYRVMGVVKESDIGPVAKANILNAALGVLGTPPPVIDLSRSSADAPADPDACPAATLASCTSMAADLADLNAACVQYGAYSAHCERADAVKADIDAASCISCFTR
jgi:hypothetical protein